MTNLIMEEYCHHCGYFEPVKEAFYANNIPHHINIVCEYREQCAHVARYFKEKEPVKLGELIKD